MPELPEVETLRRELSSAIKGKTIKKAIIKWPKMVKPLTPAEFQRKVKNKRIFGIDRRAKVLILELSAGSFLLIHLKLTGQLIYQAGKLASKQAGKLVVGGHPQKGGIENLPNKFTHIILEFKDDSTLYFNDLRKFGWARLVGKLEVDKLLSEFGPEPLSKDFSINYFKSILKKYPNRKIKQILMDQGLIAGVGNIYCDESCFCAKVKPTRSVKSLKEIEVKILFNCIPKILKFAIAKKGTSADTYAQLDGKPGGMIPYLKVYSRQKQKCKRCQARIEKIKLNGRGTHFCPQCQR